MYVRAQLATSVAPQALLIRQEAVVRNPAGAPSVQVVDDGNKLVKRPVELGQAVGNRWLVISGVKAGDKVMVDGFQKARLGQTVKPTVVPPREQAVPAATPPASAASAASSARP
ncbi:Multidrug export protein AcrE precursor [compost metagenome]